MKTTAHRPLKPKEGSYANHHHKVIDGKPVDLYTIQNKNGMIVRITNCGAKVQQIIVPDKK